ncbi:MAG TPA: carboxypeptidase-like regulatory domain-containing protein [Candidatus Thermoplasmatota archaeon]|nr:carboxypeptidase-like regulatory domain-containing protein [Candidatus Thermoplasmatota archaeon]
MGPKTLLASFLLAALLLAGCASGGSPNDEKAGELAEDAPEIEVTATTGGIRGVVVDSAIRPIKGATVEVLSAGKTFTTDETGLFVFSGLEAGPYFVKASHPLYDVQQQNVEVVAGVADPEPVKFLLTRVVTQDPYYVTLKYDGFIACSINTAGALSEECGEGVGVPGVGRVGGQDNNFIQFDFQPEAGIQSIVFETVWEPTSEAGKELYVPVGTNWVCDPSCSWDGVTEAQGSSPLYAFAGPETISDAEIGPGVNVTMFVWAGSFEDPAGAVVNQPFTYFATLFYHLPAPEGWSFVKGDPSPY